MSTTCLHNEFLNKQYGELRPTSGWERSGSLRHPCKFQRISCLGSVAARHPVVVCGAEQRAPPMFGRATITLDIGLHSSIYTVLVVYFSRKLITACSELRKVLFLAPSVCGFCLCMKYLGNRWTDLRQIDKEDAFDPSLKRVRTSRSKVKVRRNKNGIFRPFRRPSCGLCLVKHL